MNKDQLVLIVVVVLIILGFLGVIPSAGLAVAIARGTAIVPMALREAMMVTGIGLGAVAGTFGAVKTVGEISRKRGSTFLALCACGEWFIADALSELCLEGHAAIEKIVFKGSACIAFALAGGFWRIAKWGQRCVAVILFLCPCFIVTLKLFSSEFQRSFHNNPLSFQSYQLYLLIAAPAILAAFYITLSSLGWLEEK